MSQLALRNPVSRQFRVFLLLLLVCAARPARAICPPLANGSWGGPGPGPSTFQGPNGIATDETGRVYVADVANNLVSVFQPDGTLITSWGGTGGAPGQFNALSSLTVAGGFVYTVEITGRRIQKFTAGGTPVATYGSSGSGPGQFLNPRGVAVGADGRIYVADSGNSRIQRLSPLGVYETSWAVGNPFDLDLDAGGTLYVLDDFGVIYRYSTTGTLLGSWTGGVAGNLGQTFGLDVSGGYVYVASATGNRIVQFTTTGIVATVLVSTFSGPRDVARGTGTDLFVADTFFQRIRRFTTREVGCGAPPVPPDAQVGDAIGLHLAPAGGSPCGLVDVLDCTQAVTQGLVATPKNGPWYFAYMFAEIDSIENVAGVQCGITYQGGAPGGQSDQSGLDIFDWHLCARLQFPTPTWPSPGSGILLTWDPHEACQQGQNAIAGYFYVGAYSADALRLTPHPADGHAKLADCDSREVVLPLPRLGFASFSPGGVSTGMQPLRVVDLSTTHRGPAGHLERHQEPPSIPPMKLLLIGGTQFLGRHLSERAIAAGHELTLFHRGKTNPGLFAGVEEIHGDRASDLALLANRQFDRVVDLCGYFPRIVEMSARALRDSADHYTFISSVSVYRDIDRNLGPMDETCDVFELDDPTIETITNESYGGLKALCEGAAADTLGRNRTLLIRPGLIAGPYDHTQRFTWWCDRIARGGRVVVPGTPERHHPVIDVRDLAAWTLDMAVAGIPGRFNAAGPNADGSPLGAEPSFGAMVETIRDVTGSDARFEWVDAARLRSIGVKEEEFPLWVVSPDGGEASFDIDSDRAIRAGLTLRPLADTVRATLDWHRSLPAGTTIARGPTPEREAEILAALGAAADH